MRSFKVTLCLIEVQSIIIGIGAHLPWEPDELSRCSCHGEFVVPMEVVKHLSTKPGEQFLCSSLHKVTSDAKLLHPVLVPQLLLEVIAFFLHFGFCWDSNCGCASLFSPLIQGFDDPCATMLHCHLGGTWDGSVPCGQELLGAINCDWILSLSTPFQCSCLQGRECPHHTLVVREDSRLLLVLVCWIKLASFWVSHCVLN